MRRLAWIAPMAVAASLGTMIPATASFAKGGSSGHLTCVTTSVQAFTGITTAGTFVADPAGTVRLKRNLAIDGLDIGRIVLDPGWTKAIELKSGPKVTVQFKNGTAVREWSAAQSAAYYGPDILVVEQKTCT